MPSYDVTLDFQGAVGVQNKVRVVQSFSGAVTAVESAPSTIADGVSVEGQSKVFLGVGVFTNITSVDVILWGYAGGEWTKVKNGTFSGLTTASFLGVWDVRGYSRIFLQVSAISTPGSPSITREYRILGVDAPRLPRAHVVNQDSANLDGFSTIPTYRFYADLPPTAREGALAKLTNPFSAGIYMFSGSIGGDTFGMWVPSWIGLRIDDYIRDASGYPCKLSTVAGVGSDTKTTLLARGWVPSETSPATVTDVGDTIELNSGAGGQGPALEFTPATTLPDGTYFVVMEGNAITRNVTSSHGAATFNFQDGGYESNISLTHSTVLNQVSWVKTSSVDAGSGYLTPSSFDRLFAVWTVGAGVGSELYACWKADMSWPGTEAVAIAQRKTADFNVTASKLMKVMAEIHSGNKWQVREFHVLALTA